MKTNTLDYLNQSLIDAIELAKSTGTNAVDFVKEQAPDVVNQLIAWNITKNIILGVVLAAVIPVLIYVIKWLWKNSEEWPPYNREPARAMVTILGVACIGLSGVYSVIFSIEAVKIGVAPKVWLLEYAANLLK